jgi:hypothetical protein
MYKTGEFEGISFCFEKAHTHTSIFFLNELRGVMISGGHSIIILIIIIVIIISFSFSMYSFSIKIAFLANLRNFSHRTLNTVEIPDSELIPS